jgi:hypothetical protein
VVHQHELITVAHERAVATRNAREAVR